jgi:dTMP kinase
MKGTLITIEGGEGGGKSTQIGRLHDYLIEQGHAVIVTREPGGTPIAERIRDLLLDPDNDDLVSMAELLLYEAARAQHVGELILPALHSGTIVLCDRFYDSTVAYQGAGRHIAPTDVETLNNLATCGLEPDITILFDLPPKEGLKRAKGDTVGDRIEKEAIEFHERVREGYLKLAEENPERIHTIDALKSIDEVSQDIRGIIDSSLVTQEA